MADFVPGPFELLRADELRPFPADESFESVVSRNLAGVSGADVVLAAAAGVAPGAEPSELDAEFAATIGAAAEDGGDPRGVVALDEIIRAVDAGENVDHVRLSVLPYLPSADTEPRVDFVEPPITPGDETDDFRRSTKEEEPEIER